jgi:hypothetical protein
VNEQELFLRVGELAGRIGYPMPSIKMVDPRGRLYVLLKPKGSVGPVLELRSDVGEIPAGLLDFLIAQDLVGGSLGAARFNRRQRALIGTLTLLIGLLVFLNFPFWESWLILLVVAPLFGTAVSAVATRILIRRMDRRLAEVLGRERFAEALRELDTAGSWRRGLRWLWRGAIPLPPERLGWLKVN